MGMRVWQGTLMSYLNLESMHYYLVFSLQKIEKQMHQMTRQLHNCLYACVCDGEGFLGGNTAHLNRGQKHEVHELIYVYLYQQGKMCTYVSTR